MMLSQFAARLYSNWSAKKMLNLLFVFNKYLQDSMKRQETKDWAEVFDHVRMILVVLTMPKSSFLLFLLRSCYHLFFQILMMRAMLCISLNF